MAPTRSPSLPLVRSPPLASQPEPATASLRQLLDALDRLEGVESRARALARSMAQVCVDEGRAVTAQDLVLAAEESLRSPSSAPAVSTDSAIEVRLPADRPVTLRAWHRMRAKWRLVRLSSLMVMGGLLAHLIAAALSTPATVSVWDGLLSGVGLVGAGFAWWVSRVWLKALTPLAPTLVRMGWASYWKSGSVGRAYLEQVQCSEVDMLLWMDAQVLARQIGWDLNRSPVQP